MYQKLKHLVFTAIYLVLLLHFLLLIADPRFSQASDTFAAPIYDGWAGVINGIYWAATVVEWPVQMLLGFIQPYIPVLNPEWFPWTAGVALGDALKNYVAQYPNLPANVSGPVNSLDYGRYFPGYFYWVPLMTILMVKLLGSQLDRLVDFLKNLVWNLLIEFSFTKKKQAMYQDALEKRAADLMKLNVEYRNLSKEASKLKDSVVTDELTKVFNKRFFIDKIRDEFTKAKEQKTILSVIMMDIDHFKRLNDTYGHLMGDKVLQKVAEVAKLSTPQNCFCCRFGGEEFSIIMPGKGLEEAIAVAHSIKELVPQLRFEEDPQLRVTISQGIANADFKSPVAAALPAFDAFVKLADDELYKAKLEGRDRYCHKKIE